MSGKIILVTGGAGYIGSHACKALLAAGFQPVVFDNLVYGHEQAVQWGPLEQGDLLDSDRLNAVFEQYQPVAVMHFAAYAYVGESVTDPGKYYRNNVAGSVSLLQAMERHGVQQLVFSSTCATYGNPLSDTLDESHPQRPINPYGQSKLMVETMLADFARSNGLRSVCLRYFNAAGADPQGDIGEEHDPETHLIPLALAAAAGEGNPLVIFGDDYPTPDGCCMRDYIHVTDLAQAHVLALQSLENGDASGVYNLGTGRGHSVLEVVAAIEAVTGKTVPYTLGPRRPGDPPSLVANADLFRRTFGWQPQYSQMNTIIRTAWNWMKSSQ